MRAVHRHDVHARQHLVEALPVGRLELALDLTVDALAVVIVDGEPEAACAAGQRLADAAHADDAHALALEPCAQHRGRAPAQPLALAHQPLALAHAARRCEDQRHRHVGRVLGQHARRVGHGDAALAGGIEVDMVDAGAEGSDQLQLRSGLGQDAAVDPVGDRRHQNIGRLDRLDELGSRERLVVSVQARLEQLHQPGLDGVRQLAGDDHQRLLLGDRRHRQIDTETCAGEDTARLASPRAFCPASALLGVRG